MFPTTFIGLVLLAAAARYAASPDRRKLFLVRHLNVLVALSGTLGFITGVIKTFTNMPSDQLFIAFVGVGESLNNIALAVAIMILARVVTSFGAGRDASSASELVDPRG